MHRISSQWVLSSDGRLFAQSLRSFYSSRTQWWRRTYSQGGCGENILWDQSNCKNQWQSSVRRADRVYLPRCQLRLIKGPSRWEGSQKRTSNKDSLCSSLVRFGRCEGCNTWLDSQAQFIIEYIGQGGIDNLRCHWQAWTSLQATIE